ncbi:MAG: hypothetical protein IIZ39_02320 [Blautia sp.]|nr:hypothetical protein [Blautia sp.]
MSETKENGEKKLNLEELSSVSGGAGSGEADNRENNNPSSKGKGTDIVTPEL